MKLKAVVLATVLMTGFTSSSVGAAPLSHGDVLPLIEIENVLLPEAIRQLARQAHLNVLLDPRLAEPPLARLTVSVRWENVTAREALVALLDNYGLVLVE